MGGQSLPPSQTLCKGAAQRTERRTREEVKVELTLGGKWKAGAEIRYREQEAEAGRDKQEPPVNTQHSMGLVR